MSMVSSHFSSIFNDSFLNSFNRRNRNTFLFLVLFSACVGFLITYLSNDTYSSSIVVESPYVKKEIVVDLLNDMQDFIVAKEYQHVRRKLGISSELACLLNGITAEAININGKGKKEGTDRFSIIINTETNDIAKIDSLFDGLLNMIQNNDYIKGQIDFERKSITHLNDKIDEKIKELETLQDKSLDNINLVDNPYSYYNYVVDLYEKKNLLNSQLQKTSILLVIDSDTYPLKVVPDYFDIVLRYIYATVLIWIGIRIIISLIRAIDTTISSD